MSIWTVFLMLGFITGIWIICGKYEWKVPEYLSQRISNWADSKERAAVEAISLHIEAKEFMHDDIEKEIYIIRKSSRTQVTKNIIMNIENLEESWEDKEKTKRRLEHRFPGLIVNYTKKEQEEQDAVLHTPE